MKNTFRVQFEDWNGRPIFVIFQTSSAESAHQFLNKLVRLRDDFALAHEIVVREYEYISATGEWVEIQK